MSFIRLLTLSQGLSTEVSGTKMGPFPFFLDVTGLLDGGSTVTGTTKGTLLRGVRSRKGRVDGP